MEFYATVPQREYFMTQNQKIYKDAKNYIVTYKSLQEIMKK